MIVQWTCGDVLLSREPIAGFGQEPAAPAPPAAPPAALPPVKLLEPENLKGTAMYAAIGGVLGGVLGGMKGAVGGAAVGAVGYWVAKMVKEKQAAAQLPQAA